MRIIQSFAQFEEGSPYLPYKNYPEYVHLNFYSFLLSYLTLQRMFGSVTMFCNQQSYDSFIKYIPYEETIIRENDNPFYVWSKYKMDIMRTIDDDLIHVDSDVLLFNNLFDPFINDDYDIMVQDVVPHNQNLAKHFGFKNKEFLADTNILTKPYDGRCFSCGVVGLKKNVQPYYFAGVDVFYDAMIESGIENIDVPSMLLEEQLLYYIAVENDFKWHEILAPDLVKKHGVVDGGDKIGYLHLWKNLKFKRDIIADIRKKIYFEFNGFYQIISDYEREILSPLKLFKYMNFPEKY